MPGLLVSGDRGLVLSQGPPPCGSVGSLTARENRLIAENQTHIE
jgi:hypothetical protein